MRIILKNVCLSFSGNSGSCLSRDIDIPRISSDCARRKRSTNLRDGRNNGPERERDANERHSVRAVQVRQSSGIHPRWYESVVQRRSYQGYRQDNSSLSPDRPAKVNLKKSNRRDTCQQRLNLKKMPLPPLSTSCINFLLL